MFLAHRINYYIMETALEEDITLSLKHKCWLFCSRFDKRHCQSSCMLTHVKWLELRANLSHFFFWRLGNVRNHKQSLSKQVDRKRDPPKIKEHVFMYCNTLMKNNSIKRKSLLNLWISLHTSAPSAFLPPSFDWSKNTVVSSDNYLKRLERWGTRWARNHLLSQVAEQWDAWLFKAIPLGVSEAAFNEAPPATLSPSSLVLINYLDMHLTLLGKLTSSCWRAEGEETLVKIMARGWEKRSSLVDNARPKQSKTILRWLGFFAQERREE